MNSGSRPKNPAKFWEERARSSWEQIDIMEEALKESVKLQSHYAKLLNMYDGGERMQFNNADEWMDRLRSLNLREENEI